MAAKVWEIVTGGIILRYVLDFVNDSIQNPCQA